MFQWFNEPKIDFMSLRRFFLTLSGLGCLAGVYACVFLWQGKANLGTDFGAGVLLRMYSETSVEVDKVRDALKKDSYPDAVIQEVKDENSKSYKMIIKIKYDPAKAVGSLGDEVLSVFNKDLPEAKFTLEGSDEVVPAVSQKLR